MINDVIGNDEDGYGDEEYGNEYKGREEEAEYDFMWERLATQTKVAQIPYKGPW